MPSDRQLHRRFAARRLIAVGAAVLVALGLVLVSTSGASADTFYKIRAGDTLSEIADRYGTTVETLQAVNGISSAHHIRIGQVIRIPDGSSQASDSQASPAVHAGISTTQPGIADYTVRDGDTAYAIAGRLDMNLQDLRALNPELDLSNLHPGQKIRVPATSSSSGAAATTQPSGPTMTEYSVRAGDNLSEIADRHGISVEQLLEQNPGLTPHQIHPGDVIRIPSAASSGDGEAVVNSWLRSVHTTSYTVRSGDLASLIADAHGISLNELQTHNSGVDLELIQPGQVLYVPVPAYNMPALDPAEAVGLLTSDYVVQPGDTASGIAERYGFSLQALRQINPTPLETIYVGQTIRVPWMGGSAYAPGEAPAVSARYRTHVVEAGQTLAGIAAAYGLSLDQLREFNRARGTDLVVIGERLRLGGEIDPPAVAEDVIVESADLVQYTAAHYGVTPHTLLSNNAWLGADDWVHVGAVLRTPFREGLLVTVQAGDTLRGIANAHGVEIDDILADPGHGVDDPNMIVIGQEIILPLAVPNFRWPTDAEIILTDPFGLCRNWDCSYRHRGLDMAIDSWEPIVAAADGLVVFVGGDPSSGLGWYIEIEHANGWRTVYAHLIEFAVYQGQLVQRGEIIGYNGTTGQSTGPHLHFEVRHNDWYVDPAVVLPPL